MNTFLPYPEPERSVPVIDTVRLNSQVNEGIVLLKAVIAHARGEKAGYGNHPAAVMWRGYAGKLCWYTMVAMNEWLLRGGVDKSGRWAKICGMVDVAERVECPYPPWVGDFAFHSAHRAVLLAKAPDHYRQFGWAESPAVKDARGRWPYVWPAESPPPTQLQKDIRCLLL